MSFCEAFQAQLASIMHVLTNTAVAEITELFDNGSATLRLELSCSQRENEALKSTLQRMERELKAAQDTGKQTSGNSRYLSHSEVKEYYGFQKKRGFKVAGKRSVPTRGNTITQEISAKDDQSGAVKMENEPLDSFNKYKPIDGRQNWLLGDDWREENPQDSRSQTEQEIGTSVGSTAKTVGAPLCKEEVVQPTLAGHPAELMQELEGQPLTPAPPLLESEDFGLEIECVWSQPRIVLEKYMPSRGSSDCRDAQSDDFSPRHVGVSRGSRSEYSEGSALQPEQQQDGCLDNVQRPHVLPDHTVADTASHAVCPGGSSGSALCKPVDRRQNWLLGDDWREENPKDSRSQTEQEIGTSVGSTAETVGAPLCKEEEVQPTLAGHPAELMQELEGQPLTPAPPLLESEDFGLEIECVWSQPRIVLEKYMLSRGSSDCRDAQSDDFSPRHVGVFRGSRSEYSEGSAVQPEQQDGCLDKVQSPHVLPDHTVADTASPAVCPGGSSGNALCKVSLGTLTEALCREGIEGQVELIRPCSRNMDASEWKTDQEQHKMGKDCICLECGKDFPDSKILEEHQKIHIRKTMLTVTSSDKSFYQLHTLRARGRTPSGRQYICAECGKCYRYKRYLEIHKCFHTREKPFSCKFCDKCFSAKGSLIIHERVHTKEKSFSCQLCAKCFSRKAHLVNHERIHTGEKPFSCKLCAKCFSRKCHLIIHERIHTGEKPFSCKFCAKCFSRKCHLIIHERIHTGERPFSCKLCAKCFSDRRDLRKHERIHTGEKPFSCKFCAKCFSHKGNLRKHEQIHTREKRSVASCVLSAFSTKNPSQHTSAFTAE